MKFGFLKRKKEKEEMLMRLAMQDVEIARYKTLAENYEEMVNSYSEIVNSCHNREKQKNEEILKLKKEIWELKLQIPSEFPVKEIMDLCAEAAWVDDKSMTNKAYESMDGKAKVFFEGTIYEPAYEYFTAGCCVYFWEEGMDKRKSLYTVDVKLITDYRKEVVINGSIDEVKKYILKKNIAFKEVL